VSKVPEGPIKPRLKSEGQPELRRVALFVRAAVRALVIVGLPILVLAPFDSLGGAAPHHRPAPRPLSLSLQPSRSRLSAGGAMHKGTFLISPNGLYHLVMQADGNLVLYRDRRAVWSSATSGRPGAAAVMQADGNLVIYQDRRAVWSSGTRRSDKAAYYLFLESDGHLVVCTPKNVPIWEARAGAGTGAG
jgi:hypothetical protein